VPVRTFAPGGMILIDGKPAGTRSEEDLHIMLSLLVTPLMVDLSPLGLAERCGQSPWVESPYGGLILNAMYPLRDFEIRRLERAARSAVESRDIPFPLPEWVTSPEPAVLAAPDPPEGPGKTDDVFAADRPEYTWIRSFADEFSRVWSPFSSSSSSYSSSSSSTTTETFRIYATQPTTSILALRPESTIGGVSLKVMENRLKPTRELPMGSDLGGFDDTSNEGFIRSSDSLKDVLAFDNATVQRRLGRTHMDLYRPLVIMMNEYVRAGSPPAGIRRTFNDQVIHIRPPDTRGRDSQTNPWYSPALEKALFTAGIRFLDQSPDSWLDMLFLRIMYPDIQEYDADEPLRAASLTDPGTQRNIEFFVGLYSRKEEDPDPATVQCHPPSTPPGKPGQDSHGRPMDSRRAQGPRSPAVVQGRRRVSRLVSGRLFARHVLIADRPSRCTDDWRVCELASHGTPQRGHGRSVGGASSDGVHDWKSWILPERAVPLGPDGHCSPVWLGSHRTRLVLCKLIYDPLVQYVTFMERAQQKDAKWSS
jgi:hypothetical protein